MHPGIEKLLDPNTDLDRWRQATSVARLLEELGQFLGQGDLSGAELMDWLQRETQNLPPALLANHWFPFAWDARRKRLRWCLPDGRATEPFHDQYISRCRQQRLLNQLLLPESGLPEEIAEPDFQPTGFIFHLSRCGSTLVSGSFAEMQSVQVLSESPLLTDVMLDAGVDDSLRALIWLQAFGGRSPQVRDQGAVVVKWNAWDIFLWEQIRARFPRVPVLLLVRDPLEILASHSRSPGRHMGCDPALRRLHPVFAEPVTNGLLHHQIAVLKALMAAFVTVTGAPNVMVMDYRHLDIAAIQKIAGHFGLHPDEGELAAMVGRMQRHSKIPDQMFTADQQPKRAFFPQPQQVLITSQLGQLYQQLSGFF